MVGGPIWIQVDYASQSAVMICTSVVYVFHIPAESTHIWYLRLAFHACLGELSISKVLTFDEYELRDLDAACNIVS